MPSSEEPFDHDQTTAEARAQLERFFALFGRPPAHVHHHSLVTPMLDQVVHETERLTALGIEITNFSAAGLRSPR